MTLAALGYLVLRRQTSETTTPVVLGPTPTATPMGAVPPYFESEAAAQPYPVTLSPQSFRESLVARAYQVARAIPGTLAQQPCYCYCYRFGHHSLLDCFASNHGAACDVCVKEALLAGQLQKQGKSTADIREAVIRGDWRLANLR